MGKKVACVMAACLTTVFLAGCGDGTETNSDLNHDVMPETDNVASEGAETNPDLNSDVVPEADNVASEGTETNLDLNTMNVDQYVTLGDYSSISVSVVPAEVDEVQWVEFTLSFYLNGVTEENGGITDRAVQTGDTVIIDYEGKKDGVPFDRGSDTDAELIIGSGQFIDGFEDGLVGVMPGETVDLKLTFPEDFRNAEMAGQAVVFTVKVKYILPTAEEMKDSVVAALGIAGVSTVQELRQHTYDYLMENAQANYDYQVQEAVKEELVSRSKFKELPETFLESYHQIYTDRIANVASAYGVTSDEYTNYYFGMDSAEYVEQIAPLQAKQEILMQAIANRESLTVSDEELQTKLEEYAENAGQTSVEAMLEDYSKENYRNHFMSEKVLDFLMSRVEVVGK